MPIRKSSLVGSSSTGFSIDTGDGTKTSVILGKIYPAGGYQITSVNGDSTLFVFFGAADGSPAGGTAGKSIIATKEFDRITVIGAEAADLVTFEFKDTAILDSTEPGESYTGAVVSSFSPTQVSNIDDSIVINGINLGINVTVSFTGTDGVSRPAKSITRIDSSQIIATRPDIMPGSYDPYKITVQNPGISPAISTNQATQPLYAGLAPVWQTSSNLPLFSKDEAYSVQIVATDPDATTISYELVSGSLPEGLTYSPSTSTISGIPLVSVSSSFTLRATEQSGRFTDREFVLTNAYPTFQTPQTLPQYTKGVSYSTTIQAIDDSGVSPALSVVGSMPDGLSFNALTGVISGIPNTITTQNITIRATDANGGYVDRIFSIPNVGTNPPVWNTIGGSIGTAKTGFPFSYTLTATDDDGIPPKFYLSSGILPSGLTLSQSGIISGTPNGAQGTSTFTVDATDSNGTITSRTFSIYVAVPTVATFTSSGTFAMPANAFSEAEILVVAGGGSGADGNAAGGAGGAGELIYGTINLTPGVNYPIAVGSGGTGIGNNGSNSSIGSMVIAIGGGHGGLYPTAATSGGSGGGGGGPNTPNNGAPAGAAGTVPSGCTSYRNAGGNWQSGGYNWGVGGGGGGAGSAGVTGYAPNGGAGRVYSITGTAVTYAAGGSGLNTNSTGVNPPVPPANTGNGGGGTSDGNDAPGASGIVVIKYYG